MTSIEHWIQSLSTEGSGPLAREDVSGKEGLEEAEGLAALGHELRRNYISREEIALVSAAPTRKRSSGCCSTRGAAGAPSRRS